MVNNSMPYSGSYQSKMYQSGPSTGPMADFGSSSSARGGSIHIQVLGANNLRCGPTGAAPNAAIQLCVRDRKVGYENEFSYGKSVWLPAAGNNTDPTWPKASAMLDVMNAETSQLIIAVFNTAAMDNKNRFLGEIILNVEKLKPLSSPVKDDFTLQPTPYLPDVDVSGSVTIMVKYLLPPGGSVPRLAAQPAPAPVGTESRDLTYDRDPNAYERPYSKDYNSFTKAQPQAPFYPAQPPVSGSYNSQPAAPPQTDRKHMTVRCPLMIV